MLPLLLGYVDINQAIMFVYVHTFPYYHTQTLLRKSRMGLATLNTLSIQVSGFKCLINGVYHGICEHEPHFCTLGKRF